METYPYTTNVVDNGMVGGMEANMIRSIMDQEQQGIVFTKLAEFGALIRSVRMFKRIDIETVSRIGGLSEQTIKDIELGVIDFEAAVNSLPGLAKGIRIDYEVLQSMFVSLGFPRDDPLS